MENLLITLQRHFRVLTKFSHVESGLCGRKRRGKAAFDVPINPCVRSACSRSVAVGLYRMGHKHGSRTECAEQSSALSAGGRTRLRKSWPDTEYRVLRRYR